MLKGKPKYFPLSEKYSALSIEQRENMAYGKVEC